ncbi:MAG: GTPase Era, partial [Bacteroidales bacterium]|nr:GTPase Era [Bacteroidales bacterium]
VLINKIDLSNQEDVQAQISFWSEIFPSGEIIPVSALNKFNLDTVMSLVIAKLPENPPYYPKDELTDKNLRFFVSEMIREKVLLNFKQEIPYSVEVVVESFKEAEDIIRIEAYLYVMRESQKMIILGKGGKSIKKLGTDARKDIEDFLGKKVFLDLTIKVNKDWRDNERQLKRFGYQQ